MEVRCMMNSPRVILVPAEGAGNVDGSWAGSWIQMLSDLQFTTFSPSWEKSGDSGGVLYACRSHKTKTWHRRWP
jgi:hypothetical protein